jgi:peptide/nickel transport system ATP-binding protein
MTHYISKKEAILEIKNLKVNFTTYRGIVKALNNVDLKLYAHEILGLVGESGCGKSVTALTIANLLPENAQVVDGQIIFKGEDLLKKSKEELRLIRASEIASIFQDPMTFLNPVLTIGAQLEEVFMLNKETLKQAIVKKKVLKRKLNYSDFLSLKRKTNDIPIDNISKKDIKEVVKDLCIEVLKIVKLPDPERILQQYPFELSGGMRQRCMIAMALARRPSILLADEITTALDVTIQAQILHLIKELRDIIDASILLITHDIAVAAEVADRIAVMYAGNVVEVASSIDIFKNTLHPYTRMLMKSIPIIGKLTEKLEFIPGTVPDLVNPPSGCRFHPRCPYATEKCRINTPELKEVAKNHEVACHLY